MAKDAKKPQIRAIYKVAGFLAFIMLGYLGIRSYRLSVEKMKINMCIDQMGDLLYNIREKFRNERSGYAELNYQTAVSMNIIPKSMFKEGFREAVNPYLGGVDFWYSSLGTEDDYLAFEISFQGLSSFGCQELMKIQWDEGLNKDFIAVAGYANATPSGVLDLIFADMQQKDIKSFNIFKSSENHYIPQTKLDSICACKDLTCTVVWKFK